jgi:hypothetical protein
MARPKIVLKQPSVSELSSVALDMQRPSVVAAADDDKDSGARIRACLRSISCEKNN